MGALGLHKEAGQNVLGCGSVCAEVSLMTNHVNSSLQVLLWETSPSTALLPPAISKHGVGPCRLPRCGGGPAEVAGAAEDTWQGCSRALGVGMGFREMPWV